LPDIKSAYCENESAVRSPGVVMAEPKGEQKLQSSACPLVRSTEKPVHHAAEAPLAAGSAFFYRRGDGR